NPDHVWMAQQARNRSMYFAEQPTKPAFLIRDLDSKFVREFDAVLEGYSIEILRVGPRKPNLNPHAERFVQTVRRECLDQFVIFGEPHLRHLLKVFLDYYHGLRPHQGIGNVPPSGPPLAEPIDVVPAAVECREMLGGLLKSYHRMAA